MMKQPKLIGRKARRIVKKRTRRETPINQYVAGPPVLKSKEGARIIASGEVEYGLPSFIHVRIKQS